jgi:hypothetical protein
MLSKLFTNNSHSLASQAKGVNLFHRSFGQSCAAPNIGKEKLRDLSSPRLLPRIFKQLSHNIRLAMGLSALLPIILGIILTA